MSATKLGYEVRYGTFGQKVDKAPWKPCAWARVVDQHLIICLGQDGEAEAYTWVPLHTIRGEIEYRAVDHA